MNDKNGQPLEIGDVVKFSDRTSQTYIGWIERLEKVNIVMLGEWQGRIRVVRAASDVEKLSTEEAFLYKLEFQWSTVSARK